MSCSTCTLLENKCKLMRQVMSYIQTLKPSLNHTVIHLLHNSNEMILACYDLPIRNMSDNLIFQYTKVMYTSVLG